MSRKNRSWFHTAGRYSLFGFKLLSAIVLALFLSFVSKLLVKFGNFSLMFVFLTVLFAYWQLIKHYRFFGVLFINLFLVGVVLLTGTYIHYAHNA